MSKIKEKKVGIREIVYSQDDEKSFGDIFVYEPENIDEQNLGNLFIVGELKDLPRNCSYIINLLASKVKKEFYSNTKRGAEESLEAALGEANKTLSEIADQGNGEYVGKLSMVCGTYSGNRFYLSQAGKIKSLLIRDGQLLEIVKSEDSKTASAKRVFNDIASGDLSEGDVVLFSTIGLFNIFSLEEIRQLGVSSDLDEFSLKLQEEIEEDDGEIVSALIMKIEGEKKALLNRIGIAADSFEKGFEEQDNEEYESEEKVFDAFEDGAKNEASEEKEIAVAVAGGPLVDSLAAPEESGTEELQEKEEVVAREDAGGRMEVVEKGPALSVSDEAVIDSLPEDGVKMSLGDVIKEYEKMESRSMEHKIDEEKSNAGIEEVMGKKESSDFNDLDEKEEALHEKFVSKARSFFGDFSLKKAKSASVERVNKLLRGKQEYKVREEGTKSGIGIGKKSAAALIAVTVLFAGAYYIGSLKNEEDGAEKLAFYQSMLSDSRSKLEQAEVELISGSENSAANLLAEAKNLAIQVKDEYDGFDEEAENIISNAQAEIDRIDLVEAVDSFEILASFENVGISAMAGVAGNYYAVDAKENSVYKVDTKEGKLVQLARSGSNIGTILSVENFQNQELILSDGTDFLNFGLKNGTIQKMNSKSDSVVGDMAVYGRFVYLLSPSQNQIYKYQKNALSLEGKTDWLKGGDIKNAISFAIDEYIYILTSDGQVKKYFTGSEYLDKDGNKFILKQPSDKIASPAAIYTSTDQKNLYITEPGKSRILVFDKIKGTLVKQLVNESFSGLRAIYVDAEEENLIALVEGKILKIDLRK